MIGFYDYTVILTYSSVISAVCGMAMAFNQRPIFATLCLLFCGLCDMFDGKVARTKRNRSEDERSFGIQIDSLSDVIAFGVLPAIISITLCKGAWYVCIASALYILAGLIRLAYFNVTEEQRQEQTTEVRKNYTGLPITSAALIFPAFFCSIAAYCEILGNPALLGQLFEAQLFPILLTLILLLTAVAFLAPFHIRKPRKKGLSLCLAAGILLAAALLTLYFIKGDFHLLHR